MNQTQSDFTSQLDSLRKTIDQLNQKEPEKSDTKKIQKTPEKVTNVQKEVNDTLIPLKIEFDSIIHYLIKKSENKIDNENSDIHNITLFNDKIRGFYTINMQNSWICLEFIKPKIILTHYTIRNNNEHPYIRIWVIEVINESGKWQMIDQKTNCSEIKGLLISCTFEIKKKM